MTKEDPLLVPLVSLMDSRVALAVFRSAVMNDFIQRDIAPLTDEYVHISLTDERSLQRGLSALNIHFGHSGIGHPVIRRIEAFIGLLQHLSAKPSKEWNEFQNSYDRFTAIAYAIAWCPLVTQRSFGKKVFMRYARASPLTLELGSELIH
jgi:hypothetical protein